MSHISVITLFNSHGAILPVVCHHPDLDFHSIQHTSQKIIAGGSWVYMVWLPTRGLPSIAQFWVGVRWWWAGGHLPIAAKSSKLCHRTVNSPSSIKLRWTDLIMWHSVERLVAPSSPKASCRHPHCSHHKSVCCFTTAYMLLYAAGVPSFVYGNETCIYIYCILWYWSICKKSYNWTFKIPL